MRRDDHLRAARELQATRTRLLIPDDIRTYAEVTLGIAQHHISFGMDLRYGTHSDRHAGMARLLRERGHPEIADALVEIEHLRLGRWYGRRGDGETARRCDRLLEIIEAWALE